MSTTHITGKLILAGDYVEDGKVDPNAPLAGVVIVTTRERLRAVVALPMYEEVTVIRTGELAEMRMKLQTVSEAGHVFIEALKHGEYGMRDAESAMRAALEAKP